MSFKYPKEVRGIHSKVIIVLIIWYQYALVWHEFYGMNLVTFISNWCCPFSNRGAITQSVRSDGWQHCCRNSLLNISESSAMKGSLATYFDSCDSCDWTGDELCMQNIFERNTDWCEIQTVWKLVFWFFKKDKLSLLFTFKDTRDPGKC